MLFLNLLVACISFFTYIELFGTVDDKLIDSNIRTCQYYYEIGIELFVCSMLGGKYPYMRDGLIIHKNMGESIIYRHVVVWMQNQHWVTSTVSPVVYQLVNKQSNSIPFLC